MDVTACHARLTAQLESLESTPLLLFGYASLIWRPEVVYTKSAPACAGGYYRRLWQASPDHRGTPAALGRVATLVPACPKRWRACLSADADARAGGEAKITGSLGEVEGRALCSWLARSEGDAAASSSGGAAAAPLGGGAGEAEADPPVVHGTVYTLQQECARAMLLKLCARERAGYQLLCLRLALEGGGEVDAFTFSGATGAGFGAEFWAPGTNAELARVIAAAGGDSGRNVEYFVELLRSMRSRQVRDSHLEGIWAVLREEHRAACAEALGEAAVRRLEAGDYLDRAV